MSQLLLLRSFIRIVAYLKDGDITSDHANKYDDQNGNADKNHDLLLHKQKTAHVSIIIIIISK